MKSVLPISGYTIFTPPSASTYNKIAVKTTGPSIAGDDNSADGHYDFTDANPVAAPNYYRIKMVDGNGNSTGAAQVLITDIQGRAVRKVNFPSSGMVDIPVNDLVKGIYVAEINTGTLKYTRTFIKI